MSEQDRGAYAPPNDAPLTFDPRHDGDRRGPAPLALIVSALILIALVAGLVVFYRHGVRKPGQPPQVVGAPIGDTKSPPLSSEAPSDATAGLQVYKTEQPPPGEMQPAPSLRARARGAAGPTDRASARAGAGQRDAPARRRARAQRPGPGQGGRRQTAAGRRHQPTRRGQADACAQAASAAKPAKPPKPTRRGRRPGGDAGAVPPRAAAGSWCRSAPFHLPPWLKRAGATPPAPRPARWPARAARSRSPAATARPSTAPWPAVSPARPTLQASVRR